MQKKLENKMNMYIANRFDPPFFVFKYVLHKITQQPPTKKKVIYYFIAKKSFYFLLFTIQQIA